MSRILPSEKDKVSVKVESGKEARQKRLLLVNLREAHALFKEGSKLKVGFSEFASLRPPQVLPMTLRDHEVCMCKYHENIDLLLHTLTTTSLVSSHYKTADHLLNATVCSQEESKCMDRECSNCGVDQLVNELFNIDDELPVSYYQWRTPADGRVNLKAQLAPFGRRVYNVPRQFQELRHLKDSLPAGEVIIHEDFAENFQLKHQNEIMAAQWSNESVTQSLQLLHNSETQKRELSSMPLLLSKSDEMSHDKSTIYTFNSAIIDFLKKVTTITKVH